MDLFSHQKNLYTANQELILSLRNKLLTKTQVDSYVKETLACLILLDKVATGQNHFDPRKRAGHFIFFLSVRDF